MANQTLFDLEESKPELPAVAIYEGFAIAHELFNPGGSRGSNRWHIDPESFRETEESTRKYADEWADREDKIVKVRMECTEIGEGWTARAIHEHDTWEQIDELNKAGECQAAQELYDGLRESK